MALQNRKYNFTLINHFDKDYINILRKNNISSSRTSNCNPYQNAIDERINGILK